MSTETPWAGATERTRPRLHGTQRYDVAVVGAGLTGLSVALGLAELDPDLRIAVLDAEHVAAGASGRGTGLLGPRIGPSLVTARRRYGDEVARAAYLWSIDAVRHGLDLVDRLTISCDATPGTQLVVAADDAGARAQRAEADAADALGLPIPLVTGDDLPPWARRYASGLRYGPAATLDPAALTLQLARHAEQRGVVVYEGSPVRGVRTGLLTTVTTDDGAVLADDVVLAVNAYGSGTIGHPGVVGLRVQAGVTGKLPEEARAALEGLAAEPLIEAGELAPYYRLTPDGRLVVGGGAVRRGPHGIEAPKPERLQAAVRRLAPELAGVDLESTWAGPVGLTLDGLPVVGRGTGDRRVHHIGGCNGHGLAASLYHGAQFARWLLRRDSERLTFALPWIRPKAPRVPTRGPAGFVLDRYLAHLSASAGAPRENARRPDAHQRLASSASISRKQVTDRPGTLPPGPSESIVAQTARFRLGRHHYLPEMHDRYGDVITLRVLPGGQFVALRNPEHIAQVFRGAPETYHAGEGNSLLVPIVGRNSILTLDAPDHRPARKRLMPAFQHQKMAALSAVVQQITEEEVARWPVGTPFRLLDRAYALTLDVIVRAVLGVDQPQRAADLGPVLRRVADISLTDILVWIRPQLGAVWPWRGVVRNLERTDELVYAEIAARRGDPRLAERTDPLSILLSAGVDDDVIRDEMMSLLMAGHETTAVAISWIFERLLRHPAVLARLMENIDEPKDPYRTAVFKEALRVRPVIQNVARRLTEPVEIGGYHLPAGVAVLPSIAAVHIDPKHWGDDAREFRPERWLEPDPPQHAWIPFGGGVRRCIGAVFAQIEVETVLTTVLRSVELAAVDPADEGGAMHNITMVPKRGARIRVTRRLARKV